MKEVGRGAECESYQTPASPRPDPQRSPGRALAGSGKGALNLFTTSQSINILTALDHYKAREGVIYSIFYLFYILLFSCPLGLAIVDLQFAFETIFPFSRRQRTII
jgi:hypothetical protein